MKRFVPKKIFIEKAVTDLPLTRHILERCEAVPTEVVPDVRELIRHFQKHGDLNFNGKKNLLLCRNKGRFLEPCPGTPACNVPSPGLLC